MRLAKMHYIFFFSLCPESKYLYACLPEKKSFKDCSAFDAETVDSGFNFYFYNVQTDGRRSN